MMRRLYTVSTAALLLAAPPWIPNACGQRMATVDSVLVFGTSQVQSYVPMFYEYFGPPDSISILVLGTVSRFGPPIEGIATDDPGVEITYALGGLNQPTVIYWDSSDGEYGGIVYEFQGGYFRVCSDNSPNLDFSDPATFKDGDLLLEGTLSDYRVYSGSGYPCPECFPGHNGYVDFTGGSLFPQVSRDGVGYRGWIGQTSLGDAPLDSLVSPGREFPTHGRMELYVPVTVRGTTWGKVKRLFSP